MDKPVVSICCLVYNHEPYLRECFDGFVMQQTYFPIEILVHDDASTDNSVEIIKEYTAKYPDLFKPIFQKENQYSHGKGFVGLTIMFERAQGKYIAMCEGDDYWTDPLKLQKQVDFLESHEDYSMCCTGYKVWDQENEVWKGEYDNSIWGEFVLNDFYKHWLIQLLTIVFRRDCLDLEKILWHKKFRDYHLYYYLLKRGHGFKMSDSAGVYRMHICGVSSKVGELNHFKSDYLVVKDLYLLNKSDKSLKLIVVRYLDLYHHYVCVHFREEKLWTDLKYVVKEYLWLCGIFKVVEVVYEVFFPHIRDFFKNKFCKHD